MVRYNIVPKQGHLDYFLRIFEYLQNYKKKRNIFDSNDPERTNGDKVEHNWSKIYPYSSEQILPDMPNTKGKTVTVSAYFDTNNAHDKFNNRPVSGIILFLNNTPVQSY